MREEDLRDQATKTVAPMEQALKTLPDLNDLYAALAMEATSQAGGKSRFTGESRITTGKLDMAPDLVNLGKAIFSRWNRTLHDFACGAGEDGTRMRDDLFKALTGKEGGVALTASVLVGFFGLSIVTATLIATILLKVVVVPAGEEVCRVWGETIGKS